MSGHPILPSPIWEIANFEAVVLASIFLMFLVMYLAHESRKHRLNWKDWLLFDLPDSMNFAISIAIFDTGFLFRGFSYWPMWPWLQLAIFVIGAMIATIGALCKIRAITKPVYGDAPWMWSGAVTVSILIVSIYFV